MPSRVISGPFAPLPSLTEEILWPEQLPGETELTRSVQTCVLHAEGGNENNSQLIKLR